VTLTRTSNLTQTLMSTPTTTLIQTPTPTLTFTLTLTQTLTLAPTLNLTLSPTLTNSNPNPHPDLNSTLLPTLPLTLTNSHQMLTLPMTYPITILSHFLLQNILNLVYIKVETHIFSGGVIPPDTNFRGGRGRKKGQESQ